MTVPCRSPLARCLPSGLTASGVQGGDVPLRRLHGVAFEGADRLAAIGVPQLHEHVVAAGNQAVAVRQARPGRAPSRSWAAMVRSDVALCGVPPDQRAVVAGGDDERLAGSGDRQPGRRRSCRAWSIWRRAPSSSRRGRRRRCRSRRCRRRGACRRGRRRGRRRSPGCGKVVLTLALVGSMAGITNSVLPRASREPCTDGHAGRVAANGDPYASTVLIGLLSSGVSGIGRRPTW